MSKAITHTTSARATSSATNPTRRIVGNVLFLTTAEAPRRARHTRTSSSIVRIMNAPGSNVVPFGTPRQRIGKSTEAIMDAAWEAWLARRAFARRGPAPAVARQPHLPMLQELLRRIVASEGPVA